MQETIETNVIMGTRFCWTPPNHNWGWILTWLKWWWGNLSFKWSALNQKWLHFQHQMHQPTPNEAFSHNRPIIPTPLLIWDFKAGAVDLKMIQFLFLKEYFWHPFFVGMDVTSSLHISKVELSSKCHQNLTTTIMFSGDENVLDCNRL